VSGWRWCVFPWVAAIPLQAVGAGQVLRSDSQEINVATQGGLISAWRSCAGRCSSSGGARVTILQGDSGNASSGEFRWRSNDAATLALLERLDYDATLQDTSESQLLTLRSREPVNGVTLVQRYRLMRATHELRVNLQAPPGTVVTLRPAAEFAPPPLPGFGSAFSGVERVTIRGQRESALAPATGANRSANLQPGEWAGFRSRFWAWVARPQRATRVVAGASRAGEEISWDATGGLALQVYAGPVEWKRLRVVDPTLGNMLFAGLWAPFRWLAFALFFLLGFISRWIENSGLAIITLSLCVKILLYPLTRIADRWQTQVNLVQSRIAPMLAAIKREHSGEEAHRRTLAVYKNEGVSPWFTLKSLGGFAIQVPVFIAAFDMLGGNFELNGQSFLWIRDLARPDAAATLPFRLPFFGADLNLLPCLMTLLTMISALLQREASLSRDLLGRQRRQLFLMAGAFFLLFYTFPSGMVLYWTANNGWHLLKILFTQRIKGVP
jgi:YidC/Oxa1 family membrane protein insertase